MHNYCHVEEECDNKTDVYSLGVLLLLLFTKKYLKQNVKEKSMNKPTKFPKAPPSVSSFNILIM